MSFGEGTSQVLARQMPLESLDSVRVKVEKVDLESYMNRGEEPKKCGGVHPVVSGVPAHTHLSDGEEEEEYTGPVPL